MRDAQLTESNLATGGSNASVSTSVIIPARNEAAHLGACLDAVLASLGDAQAVEILVVDGESTDGTADIVRAYASRDRRVHLVKNHQRTTPAAFNVGIRAARGKWIAIVSAHCTVGREFFAAGWAHLDADDADIVGGPIDAEPERSGVMPWLLSQAVSHPFGVGNSRFRISSGLGLVDAVPFPLMRRDVFDRIGLFDEDLVRNQDTEFFGRARQAGLRILLEPRMRSIYRARGTLPRLVRQGFRNAYWNVLVWVKNPRAFRWRHFIPGLFVLGLAGTAGLALTSRVSAVPFVALCTAYLVASSLAAVHVAWRTRRAIALLLAAIFPLYHVGYGSGTLWGLTWLVNGRSRTTRRGMGETAAES